jgi:hypothetical protein
MEDPMTSATPTRPRPRRSHDAPLIIAIALSLLLGGLTGCAKNYVVKSRLVENTRTEMPADVTPARSYAKVLKHTRTVALRAPDGCANEGAAQARGESTKTGGILKTDCGVEMSELERALARQGFSVVSWDAIRKIVNYEKITPVAAARRLGAEVLFMINSLERTRTDLGTNARWEREFLRANAKGETQGRTGVPESQATQLERLMIGPEQAVTPGARLSAVINVSAVDVKTGQTIWFYEWTHAEPMQSDIKTEALIRCKRVGCYHTNPDMRSTAKKILDATPIVSDMANIGTAIAGSFYNSEEVRNGSMTAVTTSSDPANREMRVYHTLVRQVVTDLVEQFANGKSASSSHPAKVR